MTTLVFTICARNYVGLSNVLGASLAQHAPDVEFRIYVADALDNDGVPAAGVVSAPRALQAIIDPIEFANMAMMYNITEFCTALKAACFIHAFADGYDKCIYLDPDVFVISDLVPITRELDRRAIVVTPHLCLPAPGDGPRTDQGILATGVYNLGFIGLRNGDDALRFLNWWHQRLVWQAFNDNYRALFTDQRWIDFVPSLFPNEAVGILRHLGCNVAPWNFHERRVEEHADGFLVHPRSVQADLKGPDVLIFLHFSGFDFRRIVDGEFDQVNLADADSFADLLPVYDRYRRAIAAMAQDVAGHLTIAYAFDRFADGSQVLPSHRRLFRVWRERHGSAANPFGVGLGTFHAALAQRGLLARAGASADLASDKLTTRSLDNADGLMRRARQLFRLLFRALGRARFFLLVRSLTKLSHFEQHYDTFRLDDAIVSKAEIRRGETDGACH